MELMKYIAIAFFIIVLFFLPTIRAFCVNHPQKVAIFVLNFFGGLTGIGWLIAIVWAYIKEKKE